MTMYKILYLNQRRENVLSGFVYSDDDERWESLVHALNDLSSVGFDVHTPVYGPSPAGQVIEAFLLASASATPPADLERRINRAKALLAKGEADLAALPGDVGLVIRVDGLRKELQELGKRLPAHEEGR